MILENDGYSLSVASQENFTKDDIVIDYQPKEGIVHYTYTIIKNGKKQDPIKVADGSDTRIFLMETGQYEIEFLNYDANGNIEMYQSGLYNIDKDVPVLEICRDRITIQVGSSIDVMKCVHAEDNIDGNITNNVKTNYDKLDLSTVGEKNLVYTIADSTGNVTEKIVIVNVVRDKRAETILKDFTVMGLFCIALFIIYRYFKTVILERRLSKFTVNPKNKAVSFVDKIIKVKDGVIETFAEWLNKFRWPKRYGKRYEKYNVAFHESSTDVIVAKKIMSSMLFLIISIFVATMRFEMLGLFEVVISLLVGFYVIDFIYIFKYQFYRNNVENDLLQAIIVMNNAFKSGKSIPQAIELVGTELEGDIASEFIRMKSELSMGLSVETVFERFSRRIDLPEISYLAASLGILNRTGGNIIKIFSSIEKTLMNKKKLRLELKALTSSARMVTYILMGLPLLFALAIHMVSPGYFEPLISHPLGLMFIAVIIMVYVLYIYIVKLIMKVKV